MMMYVYYATVYSTIQDVIEPSLRATAMALYFCAMYVFGGALGPTVIGKTSDYFAEQRRGRGGVELDGLGLRAEQKALEPYRADGTATAPLCACRVVSLLLAGSLFAGARTVNRDVDNLQRWMREHTADDAIRAAEPEKVVT